MDARPHIGFGTALRRGFSVAAASPGVVALAFLAELAADLLSLGAGASFAAVTAEALRRAIGGSPLEALADPEAVARTFLGQLFGGGTLLALAGAAASAWVLSLALRGLWFSAGAKVFEARLAGSPLPGALAAGAAGFPRVVLAFALLVPLALALTVYGTTLAAAGGITFGAARTGLGAVLGSGMLAAGIAFGLLLRLLFELLARLVLLRAAAADVRPAAALAGALRVLGTRFGAVLGITVLFALFSTVPAGIAGASGSWGLGGDAAGLALALALRVATGIAAAAITGALLSVELGALCALDAVDRGTLQLPLPTAVVSPPAPTILPTALAPKPDAG